MAALVLPEELNIGAHKAAEPAMERIMSLPMALHGLLVGEEQWAASEGTGHRHVSTMDLSQVLLQCPTCLYGEATAWLQAGKCVRGTPVHLEMALQGLGLDKLLATHRAWQGLIGGTLTLWRAKLCLARLCGCLGALVQGQQCRLCEALLTVLTEVDLHYLHQNTCRQGSEGKREDEMRRVTAEHVRDSLTIDERHQH